MALERRHPELICRYQLNPDLPPPGDLGPLLGSGKVSYGGRRPAAAQVLHVLSPFELDVPIDRIWPRWAHEKGARFCATVYDLIPLEHPHPYLDDVRQRTLYMARSRCSAPLTACSRSPGRQAAALMRNLGIHADRLHMVGAGTSRDCSPAILRQARRLAAQAVPGLEPRFVLYPAGSDGRRTSRPW